jgi:hypothetical protein
MSDVTVFVRGPDVAATARLGGGGQGVTVMGAAGVYGGNVTMTNAIVHAVGPDIVIAGETGAWAMSANAMGATAYSDAAFDNPVAVVSYSTFYVAGRNATVAMRIGGGGAGGAALGVADFEGVLLVEHSTMYADGPDTTVRLEAGAGASTSVMGVSGSFLTANSFNFSRCSDRGVVLTDVGGPPDVRVWDEQANPGVTFTDLLGSACTGLPAPARMVLPAINLPLSPAPVATTTPPAETTTTVAAVVTTPPAPVTTTTATAAVPPVPPSTTTMMTMSTLPAPTPSEGPTALPTAPSNVSEAPRAVPEPVRQTGQGATIAAGGGSGVAGGRGSPAWAAHASRNAALSFFAQCPQTIDGDDELDTAVNPTGLTIGTEPTRHYLGALAADAAIVLGMALVQALVGVVLYCAGCGGEESPADGHSTDRRTTDAAATADPPPSQPQGPGAAIATRKRARRTFAGALLAAKLPRANYVWFMLFLQPITQCALVLASQSPGSPLHSLLGTFAFTVAQGGSLFLLLAITGDRLKAVYVPRPWAVEAGLTHVSDGDGSLPSTVDPDQRDEDTAHAAPSNFVVSAFTPRGDWFPQDSSDTHAALHHAAFKPLYGPFHRRGRLFIVADLLLALVYGGVASAFPTTRGECIAQMGTITGCLFGYLLAIVWTRPFAVPVDNFLLGILGALEVGAAGALLVAVAATDPSTAIKSREWSERIETAATYVTFAVLIKDCLVAIGAFFLKRCEAERDDTTATQTEAAQQPPSLSATTMTTSRGAGQSRPSCPAVTDAGNPIPDAFDDADYKDHHHHTVSSAADAFDDEADEEAAVIRRVSDALAAPQHHWQRAPDDHHWIITLPLPAHEDDGATAHDAGNPPSYAEMWYEPDSGCLWDATTGRWHDPESGTSTTAPYAAAADDAAVDASPAPQHAPHSTLSLRSILTQQQRR